MRVKARRQPFREHHARAEYARTVVALTLDDVPAVPSGGTDALIALGNACERFATHVNLLSDQLGQTVLSDDDREMVRDAVNRAVAAANLAAALTAGLKRHVGFAECPHYNVVTDAEWIPLADCGGHARNPVYQCELQPDHPGAHVAQVQILTDRIVWIRWDADTRELAHRSGPCNEP